VTQLTEESLADPSSLSRVTLDTVNEAPTESQQRAIEHQNGPALVLAGPGSGKTFVLIHRYARLVRARVRPERILLLTFGHNAAAQLRDRMREAHLAMAAAGETSVVDPEYGAFTFHAFAMGLVREFAGLVGLASRPRTLGTADKLRLLQDIVSDLRPRHYSSPALPNHELKTIADVISDAKEERVRPAALAEWAARSHVGETPIGALKREKLGDIASIYAEYVRRGREQGLFDLDDQILLALELLDHEAVRSEVQSRYESLMVDEYQDTSDAQAELVAAVAGSGANVLVVADDDQSIYKFRGASRHNVIKFRARYPGCAVYPIKENRRSTPQIVRASLALMEGRPHREAKELEPIKPDGERVRLTLAPDTDSEALAVADRIIAMRAEGLGEYRDFAVLGRKRAHLDLVARGLRQRNVPFHFPGKRDFFRQPVVKAARALLRLAVDPDDDALYARLMETAAYRVGPSRFRLLREARELDVQVRTLVSRGAELGLSTDEQVRFERLVADVEALGLMKDGEGHLEVIQSAYERSRYLGLVDYADELRALDGFALLRKLTELAWRFVGEQPDATLEDCVAHLDLLEETEDEDDLPAPTVDRNAVRLSTIHGAKGLEFPHVFIVQLMNGELPMREISDSLELPDDLVYRDEALPDDPHEEEERRLFYVALTRGMRSVTVTHALRRDWRRFEDSKFLDPLKVHPDVDLQPAPAARLTPPAPAEPVPFDFQLDDFNFTMVETFRTCPRRFAYRYYYRLPPRPSAEALLGRLVHETLYQGAQLRRQGEPVDGDRLAAIYDDLWESNRFDKRRFARLREGGRAMVATYGESPAWREARLGLIEHEFKGLQVRGHTFRGKIDRVDAPDEEHERPTLIDYKTGKPKLLEQLRFDDKLQLALYHEAARRPTGAARLDLELHYVHSGTVLRVPLTDDDIGKALYAAGKTCDEVQQAVASRSFPAQPSRWACGTCAYRPVCDEGQQLMDAPMAPVGPVIVAAAADDDDLPF
jgi:DNA helicase-2/ATP-dependent DNA helicase PcrA